jgi:diaminohydroxyphosphoribosylaminopyrimidine deaminase / 5-amino-6-(5-phosphoribosylamino)uracil reductase
LKALESLEDLSVVDHWWSDSARVYLPELNRTENDPSVDLHWAARALELARQAEYRTSPNPMVGAVVLDSSGLLAGEGFHRQAGQKHAEEEALEAAGERARDGTLYVNLEPCAHVHRTPPCAQAVIDAGIKRVVVAMADPDERVRGAGLRLLEEAGVETSVGVLEDRAVRLNEFYIKHRLTGRPFVTAKFAMSLDGKIATRTGESRWITGEEARAHAHRTRRAHDAILVGVNTVIADDPELTARVEGEDSRQPLRVVLDSQLRIRQSARIVGPNTLIASTKAGRVGAAEVLRLPPDAAGRVDLSALLDALGQRGILSLLIEGGGEVHASFFMAGLVDKVNAYVAPRLIGGRAAPGPLGGQGVEHLTESIHLNELDFVRLGDDLLITGYVDVHRDS